MPQIPGLDPVDLFANAAIRLLKIFPDTVAVIPIPVTTVFIVEVLVAVKLNSVLLEITCPATVAELRMPSTADVVGEPVSTLRFGIADAVVRPEITLPEIVCAKAPETFIPVICAFVPVEISAILLIILLLIKEAEPEEIAL
jgi:hypothetical protein